MRRIVHQGLLADVPTPNAMSFAPSKPRTPISRIGQAAEALVGRLLGCALDGDVPDAVVLTAVRDALDRPDLHAKQAFERSAKPLALWDEVIRDSSFASITRAETAPWVP